MSSAPNDATRPRWWQLATLANHYPPLHGLRVLAVVAVVQVHLSFFFQIGGLRMHPVLHHLSHQLWFGMDCFFMLSGFLIGSLLLRDGAELGGGRLRRFYARRSFRIFPQYYLTLTALLFILPITSAQWAKLPFEYLYLTNYIARDHEPFMPWAWSLAVEEHFYLAVPFLLALLARVRNDRARLGWLIALWSMGFLARLLAITVQGIEGEVVVRTIYIWTHTKIDILVAGVFMAYLQRHHAEDLRALYRRRGVRIAALSFVFLCAAFLLLTVDLLGIELYGLLAYGTVTSLMYLVLITWLLNHDGQIARFLSHRVFLALATLGYGIYLIHLPIIALVALPLGHLLRGQGLSMTAVWWSGLGLTMFLAAAGSYLLHLTVDKAALRLRDRFAP